MPHKQPASVPQRGGISGLPAAAAAAAARAPRALRAVRVTQQAGGRPLLAAAHEVEPAARCDADGLPGHRPVSCSSKFIGNPRWWAMTVVPSVDELMQYCSVVPSVDKCDYYRQKNLYRWRLIKRNSTFPGLFRGIIPVINGN